MQLELSAWGRAAARAEELKEIQEENERIAAARAASELKAAERKRHLEDERKQRAKEDAEADAAMKRSPEPSSVLQDSPEQLDEIRRQAGERVSRRVAEIGVESAAWRRQHYQEPAEPASEEEISPDGSCEARRVEREAAHRERMEQMRQRLDQSRANWSQTAASVEKRSPSKGSPSPTRRRSDPAPSPSPTRGRPDRAGSPSSPKPAWASFGDLEGDSSPKVNELLGQIRKVCASRAQRVSCGAGAEAGGARVPAAGKGGEAASGNSGGGGV